MNIFHVLIILLFFISCSKEEYTDNSVEIPNTVVSYSDNATTFKITSNYSKFYIDDIRIKSLYLKKNYTYYFDLSHFSTNSHPFFISLSSSGGNYNEEFTSGVNNSRATSGILTFNVPLESPKTLYYNCGIHSLMGGVINIE